MENLIQKSKEISETISFKKGTAVKVLSGEYEGRLAVVTRSSKFSVICKSPDEVYEWNLPKILIEKVENKK
jgi:ribosomal protein S4E